MIYTYMYTYVYTYIYIIYDTHTHTHTYICMYVYILSCEARHQLRLYFSSIKAQAATHCEAAWLSRASFLSAEPWQLSRCCPQ